MTSRNNPNENQEYRFALHVSKFACHNEEHKEEYVEHNPNALLQRDIILESNENLPVKRCNTLNFILDISLYAEFEQGNKRPNIELLLQITHGLHFMHNKKQFHGDINPTRIFRTINGHYLITDFLGDKLAGFEHIPFKGKNYSNSRANDIYMLGQLFYYVLSCGKIISGVWNRVKECKPENLQCCDPSDDHIAADFIQKMLDKTSKLTTKEILQNPLFWKKEKRIGFVRETVNSIISEENDTGMKRLLQENSDNIIGKDWVETLKLSHEEVEIMEEQTGKKVPDDIISETVNDTLKIDTKNKEQTKKETQTNAINSTEKDKDDAVKQSPNQKKRRKQRKKHLQKSQTDSNGNSMSNQNAGNGKESGIQVSSSSNVKSVYNLLRFMRNSQAHFWQTKHLIQDVYKSHITGFWDFYSGRFPKLLLHVYNAMKNEAKGDMEKLYYTDITYLAPEQ